jgi:hypothetical protein
LRYRLAFVFWAGQFPGAHQTKRIGLQRTFHKRLPADIAGMAMRK